MKILTTIHDLNNLDQLINVADGFVLGDQRFSKTLTLDLKDDLIHVIEKINQAKKEVFILLNRLFTDQELVVVKDFILSIPNDLITGYIGADIGLLSLFKDLGLIHKFVYNPETLLTNDFDFNYLSKDKVLGGFVSKEITLDDILSISKAKKMNLFMFIHGHMSMFYSKRPILSRYSEYIQTDNNYINQTDLRLKEPKRTEERYPLLEDQAGTHVFRGSILNVFNDLDQINKVIDYGIIDTLFLDDLYAHDVINMYKHHDESLKNKIIDAYKQVWHEGFLHQKSFIKDDGND